MAGTPQDGLWLNVYLSVGQSWKGWVSAGSSSTVNPGAAAGPDGTVWIAMRDAANSYWLRSYRTDTGFGGAWTSLGGETLYVEATKVETNRGGFKQTGQLGSVMVESSEIAHTYVRSFLDEDKKAADEAARRAEFDRQKQAAAWNQLM